MGRTGSIRSRRSRLAGAGLGEGVVAGDGTLPGSVGAGEDSLAAASVDGGEGGGDEVSVGAAAKLPGEDSVAALDGAVSAVADDAAELLRSRRSRLAEAGLGEGVAAAGGTLPGSEGAGEDSLPTESADAGEGDALEVSDGEAAKFPDVASVAAGDGDSAAVGDGDGLGDAFFFLAGVDFLRGFSGVGVGVGPPKSLPIFWKKVS